MKRTQRSHLLFGLLLAACTGLQACELDGLSHGIGMWGQMVSTKRPPMQPLRGSGDLRRMAAAAEAPTGDADADTNAEGERQQPAEDERGPRAQRGEGPATVADTVPPPAERGAPPSD